MEGLGSRLASCVSLSFTMHVTCLPRPPPTQVEDKEELGEWVGLCKIDKDGKPRKIVKCSCVVVKASSVVQQVDTLQCLGTGEKSHSSKFNSERGVPGSECRPMPCLIIRNRLGLLLETFLQL